MVMGVDFLFIEYGIHNSPLDIQLRIKAFYFQLDSYYKL